MMFSGVSVLPPFGNMQFTNPMDMIRPIQGLPAPHAQRPMSQKRGRQNEQGNRRGHGHGNLSGSKRAFGDLSNNQPELVRGTLLENESSKIDIKEDGFYSGPYRQERKIIFDVEHFIEEEELKDEITVGDRIGAVQMCPWCAFYAC